MRSTPVHQGFGVDARDFKLFARALRAAQRDLYKDVQAELRAIGQIVADEGKALVEPYSETIPPTIKVRLSYATVSVIAGGSSVAIAGLYELGNKGKGGSRSSTFRHPVFGDRSNWVEQPRHPFLAPALANKLPEVESRSTATLDRIALTVARSNTSES